MYFMMNHLHALWLVVDWFLSMPAQLDIVGYKMTNMEWFVFRDYECILDIT